MKRFAWIVAVVASSSALTVACSAPTTNPGPVTPATQDSKCAESLASYCDRVNCPSYDEAAANARRPQPAGTMFRFNIGTCGDYRFVFVQEGMGAGTDYYDAAGKLVASSSVADAPVCGTNEFSSRIGSAPKCEMKVVESGDWSQDD